MLFHSSLSTSQRYSGFFAKCIYKWQDEFQAFVHRRALLFWWNQDLQEKWSLCAGLKLVAWRKQHRKIQAKEPARKHGRQNLGTFKRSTSSFNQMAKVITKSNSLSEQSLSKRSQVPLSMFSRIIYGHLEPGPAKRVCVRRLTLLRMLVCKERAVKVNVFRKRPIEAFSMEKNLWIWCC